jgi:hypothetical protein
MYKDAKISVRSMKATLQTGCVWQKNDVFWKCVFFCIFIVQNQGNEEILQSFLFNAAIGNDLRNASSYSKT